VAPVADMDAVAIIKARSMLMILVATCEQALLVLDAADTLLQSDLANDLRRMIARSKAEIGALNLKLEPAGG
jgi:hypothetical protein